MKTFAAESSAPCTRCRVMMAWSAPASLSGQASAPPAVGDKARDFTAKRLDGRPVHLAELTKGGPVVMLMLRGWVGYQYIREDQPVTRRPQFRRRHSDDAAGHETAAAGRRTSPTGYGERRGWTPAMRSVCSRAS
jgi:hypothetical protein